MGRYIPLCKAGCLSMVIALAVPGPAMSQEHPLLVDTGVIFSAQQLERSADAYHLLRVTPPYWTPSFEDIAQLERQLKNYLAGATTLQAKALATKLESSKRQYLGYTNDGKRWIFVNGFCESWTKDRLWHEDIIIVFDGGSCFFTVRYDQSNSRFDELMVNGPWRW
jgi:hypothetical protein